MRPPQPARHLALLPFRLDLTDEYHSILGDHAEQRQDAGNGDEAERPAGYEQLGDDADQSERPDADDQETTQIFAASSRAI
jgi:hypothetical protein